jgi:hypothetical protein
VPGCVADKLMCAKTTKKRVTNASNITKFACYVNSQPLTRKC